MAKERITARDVLRAQHLLDRLGTEAAMSLLERQQPDLAEHLFEEQTQLHRCLMDLTAPAKATQQVYRRAERLLLVVALTVSSTRRP